MYQHNWFIFINVVKPNMVITDVQNQVNSNDKLHEIGYAYGIP